jgi:hypothetical protein
MNTLLNTRRNRRKLLILVIDRPEQMDGYAVQSTGARNACTHICGGCSTGVKSDTVLRLFYALASIMFNLNTKTNSIISKQVYVIYFLHLS